MIYDQMRVLSRSVQASEEEFDHTTWLVSPYLARNTTIEPNRNSGIWVDRGGERA